MKIRLPDGEIFDMPQWQDCAWQRVPCGKSKCKICGPAKKQRARHLAAGRDPDDPQSVMMDMTDNFQRTLDLLNKAAKRDGFDIEAAMKNFDKAQEAEKIPKAEDFPLYREVDGCRAGKGTIAETIIWSYDYGGDPITPEVKPYTMGACNALQIADWVMPDGLLAESVKQ